MSRLNFKLEAVASGSKARATRFRTLHNEVTTPIFMPVGTQATVKCQNLESLEQIGSQILLANTYHLLLRPGKSVFERIGGIHRFMRWKKSVLTDSGGFQIFSLPHSRDMSDEGALFRSYVDGQEILLSPEASIGMQMAIGSDIMMVLDQCVPSTVDYTLAKEAMERTHRWAARSLRARGDSSQSLFGIIQGACYSDLRKQSAEVLTQMPFDGFAIGGLAVGEGKNLREDFTELSANLLPQNLPRYLMGVGTPIDILEAVHRGVDMFDCILPTALAQRGVAFTSLGKMQLRRSVYKFSEEGLDPSCACKTCSTYSRAYLHHLIKAEETLGWFLLGYHNLYFYQQLMQEIRSHILADTFLPFYESKRITLQQADPEFPAKIPPKPKARKPIPLVLGDYEVVQSAQGFHCIRQLSSGEIMHSVNPPEVEARLLYVDQSRLLDRVQKQDGPPLVIWDVGLGAATNAMSVIRAYEEFSQASGARELRPLTLISFERDLDSLRLALQNHHLFNHLRHSAPHDLLQKGFWESKVHPIRWQLIDGDFLAKFKEINPPDLIFYDPFSYKTDSSLWSWECFQNLYLHCHQHPTELFTYSASTGVRAGLMGAGFFVAKGKGTGPKQETTIALTPPARDLRHELLGDDWLQRWRKSSSPFPVGLPDAAKDFFQEKLLSHAQLLPPKRDRARYEENNTH